MIWAGIYRVKIEDPEVHFIALNDLKIRERLRREQEEDKKDFWRLAEDILNALTAESVSHLYIADE